MVRDLLFEIEGTPLAGRASIWGLSGAGFAIRAGKDVIYIDPWLVPPDPSRTTHRAYPPPFAPDAVRRAVAVLSTHEHEDHCNTQTLVGLNRHTLATLLGPETSVRKALAGGFPPSSAVTVRPGERREITPSFTIRAFKAKDPYEESALMYMVQAGGANIFHSGDSSYFEGFKEVGDSNRIDVALLNFGKQIPTPEKPYYMNAEKLASAARDLGARIVVPMHWNLWVETREDPRAIEPILGTKSPQSKLVILDGGERLDL